MPKQANTTQKKKVVSSKSSGRRISTPVGILFVLAAGLFLAVVGTYGYTKYKERDLQAKAAKWKSFTPMSKIIDGGDGVKFVGCKEYTTIGPDAQTGKKMKVTILASKPKTLQFKTDSQGNVNKKPQLYVDNITEKELSNSYVSYGGPFVSSWWGDEVAAYTLNNVGQGDEILSYIISDESRVLSYTPGLRTLPAGVKRMYFAQPDKNSFKTPKEYTSALKTWKKQTISATQIPNCN
jgi:hypothetical protein